MESQFNQQFESLLAKYTELLLGDATDERKEQVKKWALYTYISKSMPALVKHWNELYPDAKNEMVELIKEIKELNDTHRQNQKK
jgi:hypothetical protein